MELEYVYGSSSMFAAFSLSTLATSRAKVTPMDLAIFAMHSNEGFCSPRSIPPMYVRSSLQVAARATCVSPRNFRM